MHPLKPFRGKGQTQKKAQTDWLTYQQIEDERAPVMTYLALDDPSLLTDAEWTRLTFLDSASDVADRDQYPYAADFLKGWEKTHTYDRYWGPQYASDHPEGDKPGFQTRYLCCGYAFVMVGQDDGGAFFTNPQVLRFHFRAHYFKLGLIAQFHKASFLMFTDRLADAVRHQDDPVLFRREVRQIQQDLLTFRSRFWFTEVSNHLQGRELFQFWMNHLSNEDLFQQVLDETKTINEVLASEEQEQLAKIGGRLTIVATVGMIAAILIALLDLSRESETGWVLFTASKSYLGYWIAGGLAIVSLVVGYICKRFVK